MKSFDIPHNKELSDRIVAEARSWKGTRWGHQKMTKGVRCDCAGLVRGVIEATTGERYKDLWEYSHRPDAKYLVQMLNKYFIRITKDQILPGDVLLFKIDNNPQHLAIKTDKGIIHSYATGSRRVEEVSFVSPWSDERFVGAWRVPSE